MKRLRFSPAALADLDLIWEYTAANWGDDQAEKYIRKIQNACTGISLESIHGSSAEYIRSGYRKVPIGSHVLFFRPTEDGAFEIVRILHQRMDVGTHLKNSNN